jgi:hypothetical protein
MTIPLFQRLALLFRLSVGAVLLLIAAAGNGAYGQCEFRTLSQAEWGDRSNLALLTSVMRTARTVRIGSTRKYSFNSATAVRNFLPTSGAPKVLDRTSTNPARNKNNSLAGNLLALKLNIIRDPTLGDAVVDATLPTFDHDQCIDTPEVLCYPLLASFLGSRNGQITVNEVVTLADTVTGGGRAPLAMEFVRLFQTLSAINESWGRGASADCNIVKPCGGCLLSFRIFVTDYFNIDPATQFRWRLQDDNGVFVYEGIARGNEFFGPNWQLPDDQLLTIDGALTLIVEQIAGPEVYSRFLINADVFGPDDSYVVSGYYDTETGSPSICYPRFDCSGQLEICPGG